MPNDRILEKFGGNVSSVRIQRKTQPHCAALQQLPPMACSLSYDCEWSSVTNATQIRSVRGSSNGHAHAFLRRAQRVDQACQAVAAQPRPRRMTETKKDREKRNMSYRHRCGFQAALTIHILLSLSFSFSWHFIYLWYFCYIYSCSGIFFTLCFLLLCCWCLVYFRHAPSIYRRNIFVEIYTRHNCSYNNNKRKPNVQSTFWATRKKEKKIWAASASFCD